MSTKSRPLRDGLVAALRNRRLALVLWLGLLLPALFTLPALRVATDPFDQSPFRESLLLGWDSWAILSWLGTQGRSLAAVGPSISAALVTFALLQLFLSMGALRVLHDGVRRPVLRRVVAEAAGLFGPALWAFGRYLVTLAFWLGVLVAAPATALFKLGGKAAPPNGLADTLGILWVVGAGLVVLANVSLRFGLARAALARGLAPSARGAYRIAKQRLRGTRPRAVGIFLFWLVAGALVQALFTRIGSALNPATGAGIALLFVVRQAGFVLLASTRVGYFASLLALEEGRRPAAQPRLSSFPQVRPAPATGPEDPAGEPPAAEPGTGAGPGTEQASAAAAAATPETEPGSERQADVEPRDS